MKLPSGWRCGVRVAAAVAAEVEEGLSRLEAAYAQTQGDALPPLPAEWSALAPSPEALATPFGRLYQAVRAEADEMNPASLVAALGRAARTLNLPVLP